MQLKIWHKGLILVALPLMCELAFVAWLAILLDQADVAAARAKHSEQIVAAVGTSGHCTSELVNAFSLMLLTHSKQQYQKYLNFQEKGTRELDQLKLKIGEDKQQQGNFNRLQAAYLHSLSVCDQLAGKSQSEWFEALQTAAMAKEASLALSTLTADSAAIVEVENKRIENYSKGEKGAREGVKLILLVLVFVNLVVCLSLGAYFGRDIAKRLSVIVENTLRVRSGETLQNPLQGYDEIAHLDKSFHKMFEQIQETELKRQALDTQKRDFANMVSHDLRAPLTATKMFLENISDGIYGALSDKGHRAAENLQGSLEQLLKLVNNLLDIEKMETGIVSPNLQPVSAAEVVKISVSSVELLAETKNIPLIVKAVSPDLWILADSDRIVQVLQNLLSNAVAYSPIDSPIEISCLASGESVEFRVKDAGPGIPNNQQDMIFDRFKRLDNFESKAPGFGLGLAICKSIVEQHSGTIGATSQETGSTFWFKIPASRNNSLK